MKKKLTSIRHRVLLLALLPGLVAAILIGFGLTWLYLEAISKRLEQQAIRTAEQLSLLNSHALKINDKQLLQSLADTTLSRQDIRAVSLYDRSGKEIIHSGLRPARRQALMSMPDASQLRQRDDEMLVITPIYTSGDMTVINPVASGEPAGWLKIRFSRNSTDIHQYQLILLSSLLLLSALLLTIIAGHRLAGSITRPIQQISDAVSAISRGTLSTRIHTGAGAELAQLENDINQMVTSLQSAYREMQQTSDQATEDLHETMETLEVKNAELDMARKRAQEGSRVKSEFLANMSHEIRTPLNGIIGFTNLLLKSTLNETQREYLTTLQSSAEGLLAMINDILDFSKIEAGKLLLESTPLNLRELVDEVLTIAAPTAHDKSLEIASLVYRDVPLDIVGDPLRLRQVLTNLVNNAIKFTSDGSVVVRVMLDQKEDGYAIVKISVTDTGVGISDTEQKHLFQAFSQVDNSRTRKIGGTGLGLVICKNLVEQMQGDIGLESHIGEGSTFWFTFNAPFATEGQLSQFNCQLPGKKVLLFEPRSYTRHALEQLLEEFDMMVRCCDQLAHFEQALTEQDPEIYDLVVVGHDPASLDSDRIFQLINQTPDDTLFLITAMTGHLDSISRMASKASHTVLTLAKPPCRNRLSRAIIHALASRLEPHAAANNSSLIKQSLPCQPHILAVDDNEANLKLLCVLLDDLGVETTPVNNGQAAIDIARNRHFDLVFMDVQMPVIDGMETTRQIREQELAESRTPIIALTAHALAEEKKQLLLAGMDDYLSKPISESQLRHVIQKWTGLRLLAAPWETGDSSLSSNARRNDIPVVDHSQGLYLAGGKQELADELLNMLLNELSDNRDAIIDHWQDYKLDQLLEIVHKLHGATRYCGVPLLQETCLKTESLLKQNRNDLTDESLDQTIKRLLVEIDRLQQWRSVSLKKPDYA